MQDKIIDILSKNDSYVSGQELSKTLGVSRQAVWKAINALKEKGYAFESVTNKGYRLISTPDHLNAHALKSLLNTAVIGKNLIVLNSVGSTNDYLKNLGSQGAPNGTVVASREQTSGKGRLGRSWVSQKDDCISFSFLLRPNISPAEVGAITPLTGLAVCLALREHTGLDCKIKWPNDIIIGKQKLVGILTEMSAEFDFVEYIVTGIGINAEQSEFPEEIAQKATSIFLQTSTRTDKNKLLAKIINQIEKTFAQSNLEFSPEALEQYKELCATLGREVSFVRSGEQKTGKAVSITSTGELVVILPDNTQTKINSGEVTVQGIY